MYDLTSRTNHETGGAPPAAAPLRVEVRTGVWRRRVVRAVAGGSAAVLAVAVAAVGAVPATAAPVLPPGVYVDEGLQVSFRLERDGDVVLLDRLNSCQPAGFVFASVDRPDGVRFTGTYYGYYDDDPADPCAPGSSPMTFRATEAGLSYEVDGNTGTLITASGRATINHPTSPLDVFIEGGTLEEGMTGFSLPVRDGRVIVPDDFSAVDQSNIASFRKVGADSIRIRTTTPATEFTVQVTQRGNQVQLVVDGPFQVYGTQSNCRC